ncbi:unnamed protein product [Lampetra planeri]
METRRTTRTRETGAEETTADFEPEMAEGGLEQQGPSPPTSQRQDEWGPSSEGLRLAHSRLAELLYAAAATLEQITRLGAGGAARSDGGQHTMPFPAISKDAEFEVPAISTVQADGKAGLRHVADTHQPQATSAAEVNETSPQQPPLPRAQPAKSAQSDGERFSPTDAALQQRLPPLKEFVGGEGDWGGFQRRFLAHQEMAKWTDDEALRALPAMLDSDALATLTSTPRAKHATLQMALQLLAAVYGPPSDCRQLFYDRQRGAKESPLAYRTALLALAKMAFPRMDEDGVDCHGRGEATAAGRRFGHRRLG